MKISNVYVDYGRFHYRVAFSEGTGKILVIARRSRKRDTEIFLDTTGKAGSVGSAVVEAARKKSPLLDALRRTRQPPPLTYVLDFTQGAHPLEATVKMLCGHSYTFSGLGARGHRLAFVEGKPIVCETCFKEMQKRSAKKETIHDRLRSLILSDEMIESVARTLCEAAGYEPDDLEPGNVIIHPSDDLERWASKDDIHLDALADSGARPPDGRRGGDPCHFRWRNYIEPAQLVVDTVLKELKLP